jgi:hypothetical protein
LVSAEVALFVRFIRTSIRCFSMKAIAKSGSFIRRSPASLNLSDWFSWALIARGSALLVPQGGPWYTVQDMAQQEQPGPDRPREESDAFSRQSKALNEIDEAIRSDEPAGEKLKKLVEEHSEACDEIKEELADHKEGTMPQSSPLSE